MPVPPLASARIHCSRSSGFTGLLPLEYALTKDDVPCCDFQIGVTTNLQTGKRKHAFIQIACFGDLAQSVRRLRKGVPVIVEGELRDQMIKSNGGGQWYRRLKILAHHVYRMTEEEPEEILDVFRPAENRKAAK